MQVFNRRIDLEPQTYPLQLAAVPEQVLYIDIETTGLSPEHDRVILIGCAYLQHGSWQLIQWYDETGTSEADVLLSFLIFAKHYRTLIHYNGARFDLPFLRTRIAHTPAAASLGGDQVLDQMESLDLYQGIRPWKHLLGLDSLRQQSVEAFLGDGRTENLDGADLVKIYRTSVAAVRLVPESAEDQDNVREMQQLILEHNAADVRGLIAVTCLLALPDLLRHPLTVRKAQADRYQSFDGTPKEEIVLFATIRDLPAKVIPRRIVASADDCYLSLSGNELTLKIPLLRGELKFFYANYHDYYYLPAEDLAIHKALASFVDKSHRVQATAATCYTRKNGTFLPQWSRFRVPFFKKQYEDPYAWFEFTDAMKKDRQFFNDYARHVLDHILRSSQPSSRRR